MFPRILAIFDSDTAWLLSHGAHHLSGMDHAGGQWAHGDGVDADDLGVCSGYVYMPCMAYYSIPSKPQLRSGSDAQ